ncbi:MAG: PIN/TRAM domain-containing protein [Tissierellaceae bacterium]
MLNKIFRFIIGVLGGLLGAGLTSLVLSTRIFDLPSGGWKVLLIYLGVSLLFAIISFILSPKILSLAKKSIIILENELQKFSLQDIILGSFGLIVGLVIAFFASKPLDSITIPYVSFIVQLIVYGLFAYLGIRLSTKKRDDIANVVGDVTSFRRVSKDKIKNNYKSCPKILDTSVIIDGRIADICKTGFIEGPLVIPEFVLEELQHIADSSDALKRNRGRRGLDILNKIQKELDIDIIIHEKKFEDIQEVDSKLLKLTQLMKGKIITNDYNLNKVAEVQGIDVLNINELANALKPVVLPGEEMVVQVVRDGKESGQGLAYLDDGTMIVIESGRKFIGDTIDVVVTSVLQTSAGKMIFAKPKSLIDKAV